MRSTDAGAGAGTDGSHVPHNAGPGWEATNGDVVMRAEEAEWWGASLGILVAAVHHPRLLALQQVDTDPVEVAREVLDGLDELRRAADAAVAHRGPEDDRRQSVEVRRDGDSIVISPGDEAHNLADCLDVFARGVLDPTGPDATMARGATGYAASAWSSDIGQAAGTLPAQSPYLQPPGLALDGLDFGP